MRKPKHNRVPLVDAEELQTFLKDTRQWRREHRIANARYCLAEAQRSGVPAAVPAAVAFWQAVLDALGAKRPRSVKPVHRARLWPIAA